MVGDFKPAAAYLSPCLFLKNSKSKQTHSFCQLHWSKLASHKFCQYSIQWGTTDNWTTFVKKVLILFNIHAKSQKVSGRICFWPICKYCLSVLFCAFINSRVPFNYKMLNNFALICHWTKPAAASSWGKTFSCMTNSFL